VQIAEFDEEQVLHIVLHRTIYPFELKLDPIEVLRHIILSLLSIEHCWQLAGQFIAMPIFDEIKLI